MTKRSYIERNYSHDIHRLNIPQRIRTAAAILKLSFIVMTCAKPILRFSFTDACGKMNSPFTEMFQKMILPLNFIIPTHYDLTILLPLSGIPPRTTIVNTVKRY